MDLLKIRWPITLLGLCLISQVFCAASQGQTTDTLTLGQSQLGNVFSVDKNVTIPATTTGDHVSWTATDFFGAVTSGGPITVPVGGVVMITPNLGRLGYFALHVVASRAGVAVAAADTTFAVTPLFNVASMSDSPFGVCTHFAQGYGMDVMALIALGGISQFRDEQYWQNIEPTRTNPPTYVFQDNYVAYMANAANFGLNPLMELDFANSNYDGGYTPYTSDGYTGFSNYSVNLIQHYGSQIKSVNVWNEYNGSYCNGPASADRPRYYSELLAATYTAIKAVRPDVAVAGGACVPLPITWFQDIFAHGALDYMDKMDIHPYVAFPEGIETNLAALQDLMAQYNHGNGPKPIWATECGTTDNVNPGRQAMASYLVRLMTLMRSQGVERAYWYLIADDPNDSSGLLRSQGDPLGVYAPTSAYSAYAALIQQLYGATFVRRETTDSRTRMYLFNRARDGAQARVTWSSAGTAQLILSASGPLTFVNIMGEARTVQPKNGLVALAADINPTYVIGQVNAVREIGRDTLVADSVNQFSGTQGTQQGTWKYGYYDGDITAYAANYNSSSFKPMTYTRTDTEFAWKGISFTLIDQNGAHPGSRPVDPNNTSGDYTQVWSVRRWQSYVAGSAHIVGTVGRPSPYNDGTGAAIYVDGVQVKSVLVPGNGLISYDVTVPVQVGSLVDFVVTPGPSVDILNDYVSYPSTISVPGALPATFSTWQDQNFTAAEIVDATITGDAATPAGDGVSNLLKYATGRKAKVVAMRPLTVPGVTGVAPSPVYQTLQYRRLKVANDLTFTTEINSTDLANAAAWQAGGHIVSSVDNGDGTTTVTVSDDVAISASAPKRFMRLRVTRQ